MQDAHEFLNYLLNECSELLEKEAKAKRPAEGPSPDNNADSSSAQEVWQPSEGNAGGADSAGPKKQAPPPTWIHDLFQVRGRARDALLLCWSTLDHSKQAILFRMLFLKPSMAKTAGG